MEIEDELPHSEYKIERLPPTNNPFAFPVTLDTSEGIVIVVLFPKSALFKD